MIVHSIRSVTYLEEYCTANSCFQIIFSAVDGDFQTGDREILHWLV